MRGGDKPDHVWAKEEAFVLERLCEELSLLQSFGGERHAGRRGFTCCDPAVREVVGQGWVLLDFVVSSASPEGVVLLPKRSKTG